MGTDPYESENWPRSTPVQLVKSGTVDLPVAGCAICGGRIAVTPNRDGSVPLAPFHDWVFSLKDGWRCPNHGTPAVED